MSRFAAFFHHLTLLIGPFAERLGPPGLALVAFLDSSFLPLPEVPDLLVIVSIVRTPAHWIYCALAATVGSVAGCYALYAVARAGGEAFIRRRLREEHIARGLALFQRHGLLALVVPSILPPPTPFKLFILVAGLAEVRSTTFIAALAMGRGFRFIGIAWLAHRYGTRATEFLRTALPVVSFWTAVAIAVLGVGALLWRKRRAT